MRALLVALAAVVLGCSSAQLRGEGSLHVSYLVAGGAGHAGGKAPATGGAAIMPAARLLLLMPVADPYITVAPAIVSPTTLSALGFVAALDGGASWHSNTRAWHLGTGATVAPSYMRFCNAAWCLKEWIALYGAEVHFGGRIVRTDDGGGLTASLSARLMTGRPTAWYWPRLSAGDADVNHWLFSVGGRIGWYF